MSAYGQSKFAAEGYLGLYERLHGISGMALRLGNVYGPRQDPLGEAGVIAIFCGKLENGERADRSSATARQTRDYIYVGDVVAAALAAAESRRPSRSTSAPAASRASWSWPRRWAKLAGSDDFEPELAPPRAGEVQRISLDASRAEELLGWAPTKSLEEGLRLTLESV